MKRKKLLFICETVTLAHLMRTLTLIKSLDPSLYEIHLAAGEIPSFVRPEIPPFCNVHSLRTSVPSCVFLENIAKGKLPYVNRVVESQVEEDLELMRSLQPDLVIGDFRLTLAVSSAVLKIPFLQLTNITWHPNAPIPLQVPDLPIVHFLGEKLSINVFRYLVRPILYPRMLAPFSRMAKKYGINLLPSLPHLYVAGDYVFYLDSPELVHVPLQRHEVIGGAVTASIPNPDAKLPALKAGLTNVVISLGSSGPNNYLEAIVEALSELPVNLYVSTAGRQIKAENTETRYIAPYLPLELLLKNADLFVSSGGSAAAYLALRAGIPILAIPSNLDQCNFMSVICGKGLALRLRVEQMTQPRLKALATRLLSEASFKQNAKDFAAAMARENPTERFNEMVANILRAKNHTVPLKNAS